MCNKSFNFHKRKISVYLLVFVFETEKKITILRIFNLCNYYRFMKIMKISAFTVFESTYFLYNSQSSNIT